MEAHVPMGLRFYHAVRRGVRNRFVPPATAFRAIHDQALWGPYETRSGAGSTLQATERIRRLLPPLLQELGVASLLDAGCGDWHWMRELDLGDVAYVGVDVVPELIQRNQDAFEGPRRRFLVADVTRDPLPRADLILCRDCLIHLSNPHVIAALRNFKASGARYLLANTYPLVQENREIQTGSFRPLNLERPPFRLPPPERHLDDDRGEPPADSSRSPESDARLALWRLDRIPLP